MKRNNYSNQQGEFIPGRRKLSWLLSCSLALPLVVFAVSLFTSNFGIAAISFAVIAAVAGLILIPGGLFELETTALKAALLRPAALPAAPPLPQQEFFGRVTPTDTPPPRTSRIA